jgi:nucleotide-binding universal stress UspA family protein
MNPFEHALVPVADDEDAASTALALRPYLDGGRVTLVYVVEKAGGGIDKAGVEQREAAAREMFEAARARLSDVEVDERIAYGTDVAETVFDVAEDVAATAVVFSPRGGGRFVRLLTGDTALDLITHNDRPVVVLPDADDDELLDHDLDGGDHVDGDPAVEDSTEAADDEAPGESSDPGEER